MLAREPDALEALVARCVRVKARAVAEDERDTGARLILNYGHTLGHALERLEAFAGRTHGEAVAIGMVFAARLAERRGLARPGLAGAHGAPAVLLGLETDGSLPPADDMLAAFRLDKKFRRRRPLRAAAGRRRRRRRGRRPRGRRSGRRWRRWERRHEGAVPVRTEPRRAWAPRPADLWVRDPRGHHGGVEDRAIDARPRGRRGASPTTRATSWAGCSRRAPTATTPS